MSEITFFSQLSEVQFNDRAIQATDYFVNSYAYNDYSGSRILNNYEFATGLNDYCDRLAEDTSLFHNDPSRKYVEPYQSFHGEFAPLTANLDAKIDALEARTTKLKGQLLSATTKVNGETIFAANGKLSENAVVNGNLPHQNEWKSPDRKNKMYVENVGVDRKWGFSHQEALPVEVISDRIVPPTDITFTQMVGSNDRLNVGLFCINSYSTETAVDSSCDFQTNYQISDRFFANDPGVLPTNQSYKNHFEWNGFFGQETIINSAQKGDVQVFSLGVTLAVQNPNLQGSLGKISVDIKLI